MHESFESPGAIKNWIDKNNYSVTYTHLYETEQLPTNINNFDLLIVMGGPQSPSTTIDECYYFDAKREISFIKKSIDKNKYVLGICLGAQLIGEALGAKVEPSPQREIGNFELKLTDLAFKDSNFETFPDSFSVSHWHGDMPGLTEGSEILAFSKGCPRQIIKYTQRVYGFQCHFEFTSKSIEGMIENCALELEKYKGLPFVQSDDDFRNYNYDLPNKLLFDFLNRWLKNFR